MFHFGENLMILKYELLAEPSNFRQSEKTIRQFSIEYVRNYILLLLLLKMRIAALKIQTT